MSLMFRLTFPSDTQERMKLEDWPDYSITWVEEKFVMPPMTEWYNRYPMPYEEMLEDGEEEFPYA